MEFTFNYKWGLMTVIFLSNRLLPSVNVISPAWIPCLDYR